MERKNWWKKSFYSARKPIKIWDISIDNIVISKLYETKTNPKYLIWYLDKFQRTLVLTMPKISRYVKSFKVKDKKNKLMFIRIDDEKLLKKYKAVWTKIEDFWNVELNALPGHDNRYIKTEIRIYGDKVYSESRMNQWI